jgi:hypothetical protein
MKRNRADLWLPQTGLTSHNGRNGAANVNSTVKPRRPNLGKCGGNHRIDRCTSDLIECTACQENHTAHDRNCLNWKLEIWSGDGNRKWPACHEEPSPTSDSWPSILFSCRDNHISYRLHPVEHGSDHCVIKMNRPNRRATNHSPTNPSCSARLRGSASTWCRRHLLRKNGEELDMNRREIVAGYMNRCLFALGF